MTDSEFLRRSLTSEMPAELLLHEHHLQRVNALARRRSRTRRVAAAAGALAVASAIGIGGASVLTSAPQATVADGDRDPAASAMPEPWSDVAVDSPAWLPDNAFLVTGGRSTDGTWQVVSARLAADEEGCLLKADHASMADTLGVCFDTWAVGTAAQHRTWPLTSTQVLVIGAVSADARTVRVDLSDGTSVTTNAVATPSSDVLRYFAVPVPKGPVTDAVGLTSDGRLSAPPPGLPWSGSCAGSDPTCPTKPAD